jgi:hypothetical protein
VTTPEVRDELTLLAERLLTPWSMSVTERHEIARRMLELVQELYRRPPVRPVTRVRSRRMTPALERRIRDYAWAHTDQSIQQIADKFRVNTARVSEAVTGKRT